MAKAKAVVATANPGFFALAPKYDEYDESSDFQYIPVDKIRVPEKRTKKYDWEKPGPAKTVLNSLESTGRLLEPICVRFGGDDMYELVLGQKRLRAAKRLGWDRIECKIVRWTEDEIAMYVLVENAHREQLTPSQELKVNQALFKEYERRFGPDPGKKASGAASVAEAERTKGGKFGKRTPGGVDVSPCPVIGEPLTEAPAVSGDGDELSEPAEEPVMSFATMLATETGISERAARDKIKIIGNINPDEMDLLELNNPTQADLLKIANVADLTQRRQVMALYNAGQGLDEAIADVVAAPKVTEEIKAKVKQAELTDDIWLETYCKKFRSLLQNTESYDIDALAFRHTSSDRGVYRGKIKNVISESRHKKWTPAVAKMAAAAFMEHPNDWYLCHGCTGKNKANPNCAECHGCGYRVLYNQDYHKKKR